MVGYLRVSVRDHKGRVQALLSVLHSDDGPRVLALWDGVPKGKEVQGVPIPPVCAPSHLGS